MLLPSLHIAKQPWQGWLLSLAQFCMWNILDHKGSSSWIFPCREILLDPLWYNWKPHFLLMFCNIFWGSPYTLSGLLKPGFNSIKFKDCVVKNCSTDNKNFLMKRNHENQVSWKKKRSFMKGVQSIKWKEYNEIKLVCLCKWPSYDFIICNGIQLGSVYTC